MMVELIILLLFLGATFTCLLSGYPVAFGLGGVGVLVLGGLIALSMVGVPLTGAEGWAIVDATGWRDLSPLAATCTAIWHPVAKPCSPSPCLSSWAQCFSVPLWPIDCLKPCQRSHAGFPVDWALLWFWLVVCLRPRPGCWGVCRHPVSHRSAGAFAQRLRVPQRRGRGHGFRYVGPSHSPVDHLDPAGRASRRAVSKRPNCTGQLRALGGHQR